jgi:protein-S-isoprenylcysteine O-methyltransferase Ste14
LAGAALSVNVTNIMGRSSDVPDIMVLPPVLVGGMLLIGVLIHYALWTVTLLPTLLARVLGVLVFISAGLLAHFAHLAMKRVGTNILPTQPTLALATDGPYRFSRNPLYIAAIGVYLGVTLWVNGLAPLLLMLPMAWLLHRGIVLPEERYLESKFGSAYRAYQINVRRWL